MGFSDATVAEQCPAIEAQKAQVYETSEEERERERITRPRERHGGARTW